MEYNDVKPFEELIDMKMLIEIFKHQRILDAAFLKVANRQPGLADRLDAAMDEAAEFVAEFKSINKYWTLKEDDPAKILDEHSDIIHFVVGFQIASGNSVKKTYYRLKHYYDNLVQEYDLYNIGIITYWEKIRQFLRIIRRSDSAFEQLAAATIIVGMCGFTKADILRQYEIKRDENYKRIEKTAKGENDR